MESRLGLRERLELSRQKLGDSSGGIPSPQYRNVAEDMKKMVLSQPQVLDLSQALNQTGENEQENNDSSDDEASTALDDEESLDGDALEDDERTEDAEDLEEDDDDEAGQSPESQIPTMKILHSRFPNRPAVVCFDYPSDLNETRTYPPGAVVEVVDMRTCPVYFKSYWERNCIKNAFYRAGLVRIMKGRKWTAAWVKHMPRTKFKALQAHQRINHFPDPWVIGRKDRLMKTIVAMKRKFGAAYSFTPEGFLLPSQRDAFQRLLDREGDNSLWIIKPPASACGRGIKVITASQVETIKKTRKLVVQRYLSNPYLIHGFKFDLRIYVLVTSFDPLRIYLFKEGLARFCTVKYATNTSAQLKNRLAHLTNFSVNKKNAGFKASATDKDTDGSKWSWTALMSFLEDKHGAFDIAALKAKMKAIICKTIIAAESHITPLSQSFVKHRGVCYELFGFDMMIDADLEPWLIEVNVSPSLMGSSPLDKRIKGLLMSDIFHLVGHPVPNPGGTLPPLANRSSNTPKKLKTPSSRKLFDIIHDPKITALDNSHLALFSDDDWNIVHSMEEEMDRIGHFERIYPAEDSESYASYFSCARYSNRLCEKWQKYNKKTKKSTKSSGESPHMKQKRDVYLSKQRSRSLLG